MNRAWRAFPYPDPAYQYSRANLETAWERLHVGDCEPWPNDERVVDAWRYFHAGDFEQAMRLGLAIGVAGLTVANKSQAVYATYLETPDNRLALLDEVARRAQSHQQAEPQNPNAHYARAYALGRYAQAIPLMDALAQGFVGEVKHTLEAVVKIRPNHADAHIALGACHAEITAKVGSLIASLTYGASARTSRNHFETALGLAPQSVIARIEFAKALSTAKSQSYRDQASQLYAHARRAQPCDATERLDIEVARNRR